MLRKARLEMVRRSCCLIFIIVLFGCNAQKEVAVSGKTMGTTYQIKLLTDSPNIAPIQKQIEERLNEINASMSTYRRDSEISRFNAHPVGKKMAVSDDFIRVMKAARFLYKMSNGAWDGTVFPLVSLWGFGGVKKRVLPEPGAIQKALEKVGFDAIEILENRYLIKNKPSVTLDLASIAKGYAVDQVSHVLKKRGIKHFLVEIGGEVFASGLKSDGIRWRVGINTPKAGLPVNTVYKVVGLADRAMATSGDYRQFFIREGKRYSHVIDPRTGWPVANRVVSVSIIADNCMLADGLATAVMVLGHDKGLGLIESLEHVEGLIIAETKDGGLLEYATPGFGAENRGSERGS
jgi:thiamine biosynthesis lipoprotein